MEFSFLCYSTVLLTDPTCLLQFTLFNYGRELPRAFHDLQVWLGSQKVDPSRADMEISNGIKVLVIPSYLSCRSAHEDGRTGTECVELVESSCMYEAYGTETSCFGQVEHMPVLVQDAGKYFA